MNAGLVLILAGTLIACQVLKGGALDVILGTNSSTGSPGQGATINGVTLPNNSPLGATPGLTPAQRAAIGAYTSGDG